MGSLLLQGSAAEISAAEIGSVSVRACPAPEAYFKTSKPVRGKKQRGGLDLDCDGGMGRGRVLEYEMTKRGVRGCSFGRGWRVWSDEEGRRCVPFSEPRCEFFRPTKVVPKSMRLCRRYCL